jgi:hypothetical protein
MGRCKVAANGFRHLIAETASTRSHRARVKSVIGGTEPIMASSMNDEAVHFSGEGSRCSGLGTAEVRPSSAIDRRIHRVRVV